MSDAQGFVANNGTISVTDLETALATIETLTAEKEFNERVLESARAQRDSYVSMLADAKIHLEAYLEDGSIDIEEGTDLEALCNVLDVEPTKQIEITVKMTWSVTATIPRRYNAQEWCDEQEFDAEFNERTAMFDSIDLDTVEAEAY